MKYIRTKKGIYKFVKKSNQNYECDTFIGNNVHCYAIFEKKDIIGKANTIEELCDEFVEYKREKNKGFYIREYELKECKNVVRKEPSILEHTDIFGAIWTDKGLIFVARMNNEGALELL